LNFVHLSNPLFVKTTNETCTNDDRTQYITQLKNRIRLINKTRPKFVVASGYLDDKCRKLLAKINETIPIIINDGQSFFTFYYSGVKGLVLQGEGLLESGHSALDSNGNPINEVSVNDNEQMKWLSQELELSQTVRGHTFCFIENDVATMPPSFCNELVKGRVLALFGCTTTKSRTTYRLPADAMVEPECDDPDLEASDMDFEPMGLLGNNDMVAFSAEECSSWTARNVD